ncbi:probable glutathione S-transferase [Neltuma alba]|uniref:probable glutathione S-transferase n=1 Tax=Neltuma alba TaxID=207710 RepID=UPI0010A2F681|nr:probable glutathione S-transferase [Prosopis alba]
MDEVKLLGFWASPFVHRVIWALKLKGVKYEYIEEDLTNKSELLLKSNPVHEKVPVLIHGDKAISESSVILEYIEQVWPQNPLFPKDAYERALSRFWINFASDVGMIFRSLYLSKEENREKSRREVIQVLQIVEEQALKDNKFFGGDNIGMLDIIYGSIPHWFEALEESVGVKVIDPNTLPRLYAWAQRFKQIPVINHDLPPYQDLLLHMKRVRQRLISQPPNSSA